MLIRAFCVLLFASLMIGCSPKVGEISGEVTYKGKPIPGGFVTFRPANEAENAVTYSLERDGKFKVELPVGEVRVCIDNREFEPTPATLPPTLPGVNLPPEVVKSLGEPAKTSDRWVKIPVKYYELEKSDIKFSVTGGPQTYNIELKD